MNFTKDFYKKALLIILLGGMTLLFTYYVFPPYFLKAKFILRTYRTPPDAPEINFPSILNKEKIELPVVAYRVVGPDSVKTYRDEDNIKNTVKKASNILNQIDVKLTVLEIKDIELPEKVMRGNNYFTKDLFNFIEENSSYSDSVVNLVLIKRNPHFSYVQMGGVADLQRPITYV